MKTLLLLAFFVSFSFPQIVTYPLTNATPTVNDANLIASNFTSSTAATPSGGTVLRSGWSGAFSVANYYQMTFNPAADYDFEITRITFDIAAIRTNGPAIQPINFQVLTSTDATFSSYQSVHTGVAPAGSSTSVDIALATENIATDDGDETFYIRIVGYGASNGNHNLRISNTPSIYGSVNNVNSVELTPTNVVNLTDSTRTTLSLSWTATHASTSHIEYGTSTGVYSNLVHISDAGTSDNVTLTGLTVNTQYFMRIGFYAPSISDSTVTQEFTFSTNPDLAFTSTADTTVVGKSSASIAWATNVAAEAKIAYGLTALYGDTVDMVLASKTGLLELTGLSDNTTYHYQVISFTSDLDTLRSSDLTFTTDLDVGQLEAGDVVINEIMYLDADANKPEDWVELRNTTDTIIDLTNWVLRANATDIVLSGSIAANGYVMVVVNSSNETTHIPAEIATSTTDIDGTATLALYADLSRTTLIDGDPVTSFNNPSVPAGTSIERNSSGNYADAWSASTLNKTSGFFTGTGHILFGTPQSRNSNNKRLVQVKPVSMSSMNLANDQGTYQVFRFVLNSISEATPLTAISISNVGSTNLSSVTQAQLLHGASVIGTINNPGAVNTLNFTGLTLDQLFSQSTDTIKLNLTYGNFSASQSHQFRVTAASFTSDGYTTPTGTFPVTGPSITYSVLYNLTPTAAPATPSLVASTESWLGYFTIDQINTVTQITVQNRSGSGTVDQADIDEVRIYVTGSTADPTGGTITGSVAQSGANGGQGIITFGAAQTTNATYFHIVYLLSATFDPSHTIGAQISDLDMTTTMTLNGSFPFVINSDITLPVSLAPMSYSDKGKAGLELVVKTYSEASPSVLRLMRSAGEEVVQIAEFETNGSVSHGKEYVFTDKTAAYGREYTYTLYENNVLTDKSLTLQRVPNSAEISPAFPNPFNPTTAVQVNLPERSAIDVAVYNIIGQVVYQTQLTNVPVGQLTLPWNGRNANGTAVASGIYFFRVTIQGASGLTSLNKIQKIVLVK
jgi:hypothetical protein